jgi:hypothetical protein
MATAPLTNTRYEISVEAVRTKFDSATYQDRTVIFKLALNNIELKILIQHLISYQYKEAEQVNETN